MKKKFSVLRVIGLFLLLLAIYVVGSLIWGLHSYMAATPRITPYEDITITVGQTVTPDDLALIERSQGARITGVTWENDSTRGIVRESDGSSFTVTEGEGIIYVHIFAEKNKGGEDRDKTIAVTVVSAE